MTEKAKGIIDIESKGLKNMSEMANLITGVNQGLELTAKLMGVVTKATKAFIDTGSQFEQYNLQFQTLKGSVEGATARVKELFDFASSTPFELAGVIEAGKTLDAYKIKAEGALTAVGDAAAAMGEDFNETALALAGAATGEMERLKKFGIASFQITQELGHAMVRNTQEGLDEIAQAVVNLFDKQFGGGMARLRTSMGGIINELDDSWTKFMKMVADSQAFETAKTILGDMLKIVTELFDQGQAEQAAALIGKALSDALWTGAIAMAGAAASVFDVALGMKDIVAAIPNFQQDFDTSVRNMDRGIQGVLDSIINATIGQGGLGIVSPLGPGAGPILPTPEEIRLARNPAARAEVALIASRAAADALAGGSARTYPLPPGFDPATGRQQFFVPSGPIAGGPAPIGEGSLGDELGDSFFGGGRFNWVTEMDRAVRGDDDDSFGAIMESVEEITLDTTSNVVEQWDNTMKLMFTGWDTFYGRLADLSSNWMTLEKASIKDLGIAAKAGAVAVFQAWLSGKTDEWKAKAAEAAVDAVMALPNLALAGSKLAAAAGYTALIGGAAVVSGAAGAWTQNDVRAQQEEERRDIQFTRDVEREREREHRLAAEEIDDLAAGVEPSSRPGTRQISRTVGVRATNLNIHNTWVFNSAAVFGVGGVREFITEEVVPAIQDALDSGELRMPA